MREPSIAKALVDELEELASRGGATRVRQATVRIGSLSGVSPDALTLAYPEAAKGSVADGSTLKIEWVQACLRCTQCGAKTVANEPVFLCGACGSDLVDVISGHELHIVAAELEWR